MESNNGKKLGGAEAATENAPDPDTIKMFVGQIPKSWEEKQMTEFFEKYGPVYELHIFRDKGSGDSKGCCSVTYYHRKDAIGAQNALHNIYKMPGLREPVQMKPAETESRKERTIFVGMLCKELTDDDVLALFNKFGQIEECTILRERTGESKGCAFVTFVNRLSAQQAVNKMNRSMKYDSAPKPLVVNFSEEGRGKKSGGGASNERNSGDYGGGSYMQNMYNNQFMPHSNPHMGGGQSSELLDSLASLLQHPALPTLLESVRSGQMPMLGGGGGGGGYGQMNGPGKRFGGGGGGGKQQRGGGGQDLSFFGQPSSSGGGLARLGAAGEIPGMPAASANFQQPQQRFRGKMMMMNSSMDRASTDSRGPKGCNLFIYNLPSEFTDDDLTSLFCDFGAFLSAKVIGDANSHVNKGYGFVSFADEGSAQNAIQVMDGVQVGNKRLKVQLKRSEMKPYDR